VQCVVFGVFALIGGMFLWAGLVLGDWRRIVFGISVAVAWPLDTFVWRATPPKALGRPPL
jgi:hypothetical protein